MLKRKKSELTWVQISAKNCQTHQFKLKFPTSFVQIDAKWPQIQTLLKVKIQIGPKIPKKKKSEMIWVQISAKYCQMNQFKLKFPTSFVQVEAKWPQLN